MQKYKKILNVCFVFFIILASGCASHIPSIAGDGDPRFQCQINADCMSEETACNNC